LADLLSKSVREIAARARMDKYCSRSYLLSLPPTVRTSLWPNGLKLWWMTAVACAQRLCR